MVLVKNRVESNMIGAGQELQLPYMYCLPRIESPELCSFCLSECWLVISLGVLNWGELVMDYLQIIRHFFRGRL